MSSGPHDGPRQCTSCGASAARRAARFCESCGAELPPSGEATSARSTDDVEERFAALDEHPDTPQLMAHVPDVPGLGPRPVTTILWFVLFLVLGLGITVILFGLCPPLGFIPLALMALVGYGFLKNAFHPSALSKAPVQRLPALVVGERTQLLGGGEQAGARTKQSATLQFRDGSRHEVVVMDDESVAVAQGDMGIAYVKAHYLLGFARLPV